MASNIRAKNISGGISNAPGSIAMGANSVIHSARVEPPSQDVATEKKPHTPSDERHDRSTSPVQSGRPGTLKRLMRSVLKSLRAIAEGTIGSILAAAIGPK